MSNEVLFSEKQKFNQWWLWLILLSLNGLFLYGFFKQVINGEQFGDNPMSNTGLLFATCSIVLLSIFFLNISLQTVIKRDGVYVRFFPFHFRFRYYAWDKLTKVYVRQYSALKEYGGWGIRYGPSDKGVAYNVSGDKGLQLELSAHDKLLIGTNKSDELVETLRSIGQLKE